MLKSKVEQLIESIALKHALDGDGRIAFRRMIQLYLKGDSSKSLGLVEQMSLENRSAYEAFLEFQTWELERSRFSEGRILRTGKWLGFGVSGDALSRAEELEGVDPEAYRLSGETFLVRDADEEPFEAILAFVLWDIGRININ